MNLDSILKFVDLIHQFRTIERKVLVHKSERDENDAEHSFTLAMLAWYINDTHSLGLDASKLMKYALAHDLVEVYAGDTFFYQTTDQALSEKHEKEAAAARRLQQELPEFVQLHEMIEQYEKREDIESKFIYALDKVEPVLSIYLDDGRTWKQCEVTLEMLESMKSPKVAADPTIEALFKEIVTRLEKEKDRLFDR
jgi:putative hydrolase of HD superfamily